MIKGLPQRTCAPPPCAAQLAPADDRGHRDAGGVPHRRPRGHRAHLQLPGDRPDDLPRRAQKDFPPLEAAVLVVGVVFLSSRWWRTSSTPSSTRGSASGAPSERRRHTALRAERSGRARVGPPRATERLRRVQARRRRSSPARSSSASGSSARSSRTSCPTTRSSKPAPALQPPSWTSPFGTDRTGGTSSRG